MRIHQNNRIKQWNNKLNELTVQCKFSTITELESQNHVRKRIQNESDYLLANFNFY